MELINEGHRQVNVAHKHEIRVVKHLRLHLLTSLDSSRCLDAKDDTLHLSLNYLYICLYFVAISSCLFFLCRLKINHMMELQHCAFILELGTVTKMYNRSMSALPAHKWRKIKVYHESLLEPQKGTLFQQRESD
jgi:hypothetical protein